MALFKEWLTGDPLYDENGRHVLALFDENAEVRMDQFDAIRAMVRNHYVDDSITADRLAGLGAEKTAALFREELPSKKKSRSGDMGEILATEIAEQRVGCRVPVRRLRWKDGRDMALRGDDLTAIIISKAGKVTFVKGESKSRAVLSVTVLAEASSALDRDRGRPTRHSVLFVAKRLREAGDSELALKLEEAVLQSFRGSPVEHLLFVLTGNNPSKLLTAHHAGIKENVTRRHVVGFWIKDHGEFIRQVFEGF